MLETEIRSTQALKDKGVEFWDNLKQRNLKFAERLQGCNSSWAQRAEKCADSIKFKECANGYLVFKSAHFCRIRGCPICEWRKSRKIAKLVAIAVKNYDIQQNDYWQQLTFSTEPIPVSELTESLDRLGAGFGRLHDLKDWRFKGGFHFTQFQWVGGKVKILVHFLGLSPATMSSRYYMSRKKWATLWTRSLRQENVPAVEVQKFGAIPFEYVAFKSKFLVLRQLNLELCPDSVLPQALEHIHRRKLLTGVGCFKCIEKPYTPRRRCYYPSEKAALWAMKSRHFGYLPNPDRDEHDDQFLSLPEVCWDKELVEEIRREP